MKTFLFNHHSLQPVDKIDYLALEPTKVKPTIIVEAF